MNWKFWKKETDSDGGYFTSTDIGLFGPRKPKTVVEQVEELTKRVDELEKETQVYASGSFLWTLGDGGLITAHKSRPRVGEGVRLLMEHLGLTFKAGETGPDLLVKKKKK